MIVSTFIVSQGLIERQGGVLPHPDILLWSRQLSAYRRTWFACADKTPLAWYAVIVDAPPAALLAAQCSNLPANVQQCWVASPYSCQLFRDQVRVIPEGLFPWCEEDARWLCDTLNVLLEEEGMHLLHAGAAVLLACRDPMHVCPRSFAMIAGKTLPNQHPEGEDGGRLMRLVSEIQMTLHGGHAPRRSGQPDIHGLWFWGGCAWPAPLPGTMPSIATRNPFLHAIAAGKVSRPGMVITEVERMGSFLKQKASLPKKIILAGEGYAVLLTKPLLPMLRKASWIPRAVQEEAELLSVLRGAI